MTRVWEKLSSGSSPGDFGHFSRDCDIELGVSSSVGPYSAQALTLESVSHESQDYFVAENAVPRQR